MGHVLLQGNGVVPARAVGGRARKKCWTIAEHAGDPDPHGMQHLLARATWDTDGVRDDLRDYVTGHLGDTAVLVVDETGDE
jgi:SRSO17 transposase